MERPIAKPIGSPVEDLDTPALVVDITLLEQNIEKVHSFFRDKDAKLRPHVESHRCPTIARKQMASTGTVNGISVNTVGEAEVFAQHGFDDILVLNGVTTPQKIVRLCAIAKHTKITVAVDWPTNIQELSTAAQQHKVILGCIVDIDTLQVRGGVAPGPPAVKLVKSIVSSSGLRFSGLMTYQGMMPADQQDELVTQSNRSVQQVIDTRELVEREGIEVASISVGGTPNYDIVGSIPGVTEVVAGGYALMDARYATIRPELKPAAKVMTTVTSRPEPRRALADAGQKSVGIDTGLPVIDGVPGAYLEKMSAEHGWIDLEGESQQNLTIGTKVWLTPWDAGNCINLYDFISACRDDKLEGIWSVSARGRYR